MTDHDPFEDRLRETLRSGDPAGDRPEVEGFLMDVHSGARSRRRRRTTAVAAAATLVVGGAVAVGSSGLLADDQPPIADGTMQTTADSTGATSSSAPMTGSGTGDTINFTPQNTSILSVTSTDDAHQWALALTQDGTHCGNNCISVITRSPDTGDWGSPLLAGGPYNGGPATRVSQLRYVSDPAGGFDGWLFEPGLYSIHGVDGGSEPAIWQGVDVGGSVTSLEARGQTVYALVESAGHSTLVMSRTDKDAFESVDTGQLGHASSLVATAGVVAFLDNTGNETSVVASPADESGAATGAWTRSQPCLSGADPIQLSSASATLWALCTDGSVDTVSFKSVQDGTWTHVTGYRSGSGPGTLLTARSINSAVLHLADNTQLMVVTATGAAPLGTSAPPFTEPTMLGFTNPDLGFAVADGALWRTEDGGSTWTQDQVIPAAD